MDFALSDEQKNFVDAIRNFCDRECGTPDQRERLTDGYREHHSFEIYNQMAELGWLGVTIPEQYGGSGGSMLDACLFMEETSRGLAPIGGYATTLIVAGATQRFGTEAQKEEILDIELDGKPVVKPDPRKARFSVIEKAFKQRNRLQARGI